MRPPLPHHALLLAAFLSAGAAGAVGAGTAAGPRDAERGFPLLEVVAPGPADADPQNFDIDLDPRGALYVANGAGLLIYDGAWWRRIEIGAGRTAFSVAADDAGRVAAGGTDDFGVLEPDAAGTPRLRSLLPLVPAGQRPFGQVMQIQPAPGGFLFVTQKWLFRWDGRSISVVATVPGDRPFASLLAVAGQNYLWRREAGLLLLQGDRLVPVPGGAVFRDRRIDTLLPFDSQGDPRGRDLLVSVRGEGLFRLGGDGRVAPFAPEASKWTAEKRILPGGSLRLPDGRWALGSILGGLLLLRPDGAVDQVIDSRLGLPDDFVGGVALDREGSLWLSLNTSLARLEVASPLSVIDARSGLPVSTYQVVRHQGRLWVATASGVSTVAEPTGAGGPLRLRPVQGLPPSGWGLASVGDDLLVGTGFGLYRVRGDRPDPQPFPGGEQGVAYDLEPSRRDPDRVWAAMDFGLAELRRTGGSWRLIPIAGTPSELRTVVEGEDGTVWCGSKHEGLAAVEVPASGPPRVHRVVASGWATAFRVRGEILAVVDDQVRRVDEARRALIADPALAVLGRGLFSLLVEDAAGNLWMNTRPPSVAPRQGQGWGPPRRLVEIPARAIESIFAEPDGVVWLSSEKGLFRYAPGAAAPGTTGSLPAPQVSRIVRGGGGADGTLFGGGAGAPGAPGARPPALELPAGVRRLRVEIAPLSFRPGLRYQTQLSPLDAGWSAPSAEPFAELTRLPPNDYTLRMRTVGPDGATSPEAVWSFRVRPPWHQTSWALGLGLLLLLAGVRVYGGLRHRALRQRAADLELRVAAQTDELQRTVEELRQAHAGLAGANVRLEELSRSDDLTGIANRRRLQSQLKIEWDRAVAEGRPLAFVLVDLDHFKRLNDTRGHSEGDLCLQRVAHYLDGTVSAAGGLVARYGGEEFAVLLPGIDLPAAHLTAERLRRGIEALALPHEAAPAGRITASFGVAAWVPQAGEKPESLIEDADLALYRAKSEGRNRVCAAAA
jgi:diguanylate cyclase (GGDEF)-like protein